MINIIIIMNDLNIHIYIHIYSRDPQNIPLEHSKYWW